MKKFIILIFIFISFQINAETNNIYGRFVGSFDSRALEDGRKLKLLKNLVFIDPQGKKWIASKGRIVDGASIPRFFWSLIGGPLTGKYRMASVIHDVACDKKEEKWFEVHRVFYQAMLASGVSKSKALIMYFAVKNFGPRWNHAGDKRLSRTEFKKLITTTKDITLEDAKVFSKKYKLFFKNLSIHGESLETFDYSQTSAVVKYKNITMKYTQKIDKWGKSRGKKSESASIGFTIGGHGGMASDLAEQLGIKQE